jgi:hypothetical protein
MIRIKTTAMAMRRLRRGCIWRRGGEREFAARKYRDRGAEPGHNSNRGANIAIGWSGRRPARELE